MSDFHQERLTGLGGSDIGAILGMNRYRTPYQVWMEKTGRAEAVESSLPARWGIYAEEFVAREYSDRTGAKVQRYNAMLRHPEAPLIGHVDRLVIPEGAKVAAWRKEIRTDLGLECKTVSAYAVGRDSEWGKAGTDEVPRSYLLQVATYQALTGCQHWDLAALIGNTDFRIYHFTRDAELEGYLLEEASRWWRDYVIADTPPPPSSELEARQRWPGHAPGKVLEADPTLYTDLTMLARIKAEIRQAEQREKVMRDSIIPVLADAEIVTWAGKELLSYRANKDTEKTDWKSLAQRLLPYVSEALRAQLLTEFTVTTPGARVLRLAKNLETEI
jgi:putative phage-type endonuclease